MTLPDFIYFFRWQIATFGFAIYCLIQFCIWVSTYERPKKFEPENGEKTMWRHKRMFFAAIIMPKQVSLRDINNEKAMKGYRAKFNLTETTNEK